MAIGKGDPFWSAGRERPNRYQLIEDSCWRRKCGLGVRSGLRATRMLRRASLLATFIRLGMTIHPENLGEYRELLLSFGYKVGDLLASQR